MLSTNLHKSRYGSVWDIFIPLISALKVPLKLLKFLDTPSVRPVKRLEWFLHTCVSLCFFILVILPAIAGDMEMKHFAPALFIFISYIVITIISELEWLRVRRTIGDRIYSIHDVIESNYRPNDQPENAMKLSGNDEFEIVNDPYKLNPTAVDLVIQFGFFVAAAIVKIGGVKVHNPDFGTASQWYKSLWTEIALEMDSRNEQVAYAVTRSYEASVVVFHDGVVARAIKIFSGQENTDGCDCGSDNCLCEKNKK